jgi:hypothetical protein
VHRAHAWLTCAALAAVGSIARAETAEEVRADALFREGMAKFDSGQVGAACALFTESLRLDPKLGTLLNLALCHEREGKPATAWVEFNHAAAWATQNGQRDRREFANQHAITLEAQLSRVLLKLPPARELSSVEVDGEPLPEPRWFLPMFLDPGEHTVSVSAPGKLRETLKVVVPRRPSMQLIPVPRLRDVGEASSAGPSTGDGPVPAAVSAEQPPPAAPAPSTNKAPVAAWVAVSVGLAGIAVGSVFGVLTLQKRDDIGDHCAGNRCDATGAQLHDDAQGLALVSTIGFGVGVAGIATAAVLFLTAPKAAARVSAWLAPAGVRGAF